MLYIKLKYPGKMKRCKYFLLPVILALVMSCSKTSDASLYVPSSNDVTATATLEELQQGRTLYINNCGSCHHLYSPDDFSATRWRSIMTQMAPETRMNASQVTLVTKYVTRGQ